MNPVTTLNRLNKIKFLFGTEVINEKLKLLRFLQRRRLSTHHQVQFLHDVLCFMSAYPDDKSILQQVSLMLAEFDRRSDLHLFRHDLMNSGIKGTAIHYNLFWPMAQWIVSHWPECIRINWSDFENSDKLLDLLPQMVTFNESSLFDEYDFTPRQWINRLKSSEETDARFFIKRMEALYQSDFMRESVHDRIDPPYEILPGEATPETSTCRYMKARKIFQNSPLRTARPALPETLFEKTYSIRKLSASGGQTLINLARTTMITHERDLDAFSYGNKHDVRLVEFNDGLQIACIGMTPERRYLLHASYGFLDMRNGMPIGYFPVNTLFNTANVAFNIFSAFRGAEAAIIYCNNLTLAHQLLDAKTFIIDPYQLGHNNKEGLESGVWWFYYKLGFMPTDLAVRKLLKRELAKMHRNSNYRSNLEILNKLASENLYYRVGNHPNDNDILENLDYIPTEISNYLADRYGADRESAIRVCVAESTKAVGIRSLRSLSLDQREVWRRWSPLLLNLDNIARWSKKDKNTLAKIVSAKGGKEEGRYLELINKHKRLKQAILKFASNSGSLS